MDEKLWFLVSGVVFMLMGLSISWVKRMPLTTAVLYVLVGIAIGPYGLAMLAIEPLTNARLLEHACEVAIVISLFTSGLKLRVPLRDRRWRTPVLLATASMALTVLLITAAGSLALGLPLGTALLLGAVLAPTDPVLASDVQVENPADRDRLRFAVTGEAALNDGTAFPFVMLALGLMGLHDLGAGGSRWLAIDVAWAVAAGLGIGWVTGKCVGRVVLFLRREHREAVGLDDFLALGLIAIAYGLALLVNAYGFLAVFAAGLAVRSVEMERSGEEPVPRPVPSAVGDALGDPAMATHELHASAYLLRAMLFFNEHLERIGEVAVVVVIGAMLEPAFFDSQTVWFVALLLLVIRPLAVLPVLAADRILPVQRRLIAWFGIRGVGSLYYLMYAINRGIDANVAEQLFGITLAVVSMSIVVHGISVTPLMHLYRAVTPRTRRDQASAP